MKAKLLKEQMGVLAGTEMEVLGTGRAWTLRAPSGAEIVVPACDVEMVPDTEPFSEPLLLVTDEYQELLDEQRNSEVDPKDPGLLVNILGDQPQVEAEPHFSTAPSDLDESKPAKKKAAKKKVADD